MDDFRDDGAGLKPCPFCGSNDISDHEEYKVCENCGTIGPDHADDWNVRAPDPRIAAIEAERDRLREALEEIAELPGRRWQRKTARAALSPDQKDKPE